MPQEVFGMIDSHELKKRDIYLKKLIGFRDTGTCWVPSFDISPRDKRERLAYTRTFAKEVFNDASCHL